MNCERSTLSEVLALTTQVLVDALGGNSLCAAQDFPAAEPLPIASWQAQTALSLRECAAMAVIRIEQLALREKPNVHQHQGMHYAFTSRNRLLRFEYESALQAAKSIENDWGGALYLVSQAHPSKDDVIAATCTLLGLGQSEVEFTREAAAQFVDDVVMWKLS